MRNGPYAMGLKLAAALAAGLIAACATNVPQEIREPPADNPNPDEVRKSPDDFLNRPVLWGGTIIKTENRPDSSRVTLLARNLSKSGRPQDGDDSPGRFIAIVPRFLDPQVYAKDRLLTVSGTVAGTEVETVGEFPYTYPIIKVAVHYLWPEEQDPFYYPPPYYGYPWRYDPWFYDPWWYGPYYR
jgi:outer membrane lipoprotein